jgi:carbamoyl-phosphate synthase large subunit
VLGPEMKSTGEVMGIANNFGLAFAKSQTAAFGPLPKSGAVFISLSERDKESGWRAAREMHELGFKIYSTAGTNAFLSSKNVPSELVRKNSDPG